MATSADDAQIVEAPVRHLRGLMRAARALAQAGAPLAPDDVRAQLNVPPPAARTKPF